MKGEGDEQHVVGSSSLHQRPNVRKQQPETTPSRVLHSLKNARAAGWDAAPPPAAAPALSCGELTWHALTSVLPRSLPVLPGSMAVPKSTLHRGRGGRGEAGGGVCDGAYWGQGGGQGGGLGGGGRGCQSQRCAHTGGMGKEMGPGAWEAAGVGFGWAEGDLQLMACLM